MNNAQHKRFELLYRKHVSALRRQGKADSTIELYSRAIRRICEYFDSPPDRFTQEQLEAYFEAFVISHSWETVKVHRNGISSFISTCSSKSGIGWRLSDHPRRRCYRMSLR